MGLFLDLLWRLFSVGKVFQWVNKDVFTSIPPYLTGRPLSPLPLKNRAPINLLLLISFLIKTHKSFKPLTAQQTNHQKKIIYNLKNTWEPSYSYMVSVNFVSHLWIFIQKWNGCSVIDAETPYGPRSLKKTLEKGYRADWKVFWYLYRFNTVHNGKLCGFRGSEKKLFPKSPNFL